MNEEEDLVLEVSDEDLKYMLKEGFVEENEKGEVWLTPKGEQFIRDYMDKALREDSGDAE